MFEELTFDDVQEFAEDDMVQRLEELQQAIATCITALRGASAGSERAPALPSPEVPCAAGGLSRAVGHPARHGYDAPTVVRRKC